MSPDAQPAQPDPPAPAGPTDQSVTRRGSTSDRRLFTALAVVALLLAVAYLWMESNGPGAGVPSLAQYVLLAGNVLVLVAVVFSLLRYVIRLLSERRAGVLGARFRFKLVATFVGLCLAPAMILYVAAVYILLAAVDKALSPDVQQMVFNAKVVVGQFYEDAEADMGQDLSVLSEKAGPTLAELPREQIPFAVRPWLETARIGAVRIVLADSPEVVHVGVPALIGKRSPLDPYDLPAAQLASDLQQVGSRGRFVRQQAIGSKLFLIAGAPLTNSLGVRYGTLLAARRVPADLKQRADQLVAQAAEHERVAEQEPWVKAEHALNFLWLSLLITLGATWVGFTISRGITVPIQRLAEGTREVRRGNLAHVVEWEGSDELAELVAAFNGMAAELRSKADEVARKTGELEEANLKLEEANAELERRRAHVLVMLETMTAGVIAVDAEGRLVVANRAAQQILELPAAARGGQPVDEFLSGAALGELRSEIAQALRRRFVRRERATTIALPRGEVHLQLVLASQPDPRGERGLLVLLEDVTELVRAQKLATWRAAARRIAHEIKNPLTPIQLSAQRILKKWHEKAPDLDQALESGVGTIIAEVAGLKQMVDEFSHFARMPEVRPVPGDLAAVLESVRALYAGHERLDISVQCPESLRPVPFDPELLRRAIVNLVDNAVEATGGAGHVVLGARLEPDRGTVEVSVADDGPGIKAEDRESLFLPYFTTRSAGTGLGLAIVHRIVVDHGGRVRAEANEPVGARFVIEIPLEAAWKGSPALEAASEPGVPAAPEAAS